jgi:predicted tellurium resistance membrane protein TerC
VLHEFGVLFQPAGLASLISLTVLEIVLGIDNIIFVAISSQKVTPAQQGRVRRMGIALALVMRIGLLLTLSWIMGLTATLFTLFDHDFSGRDLVLLAGGLFLIAKATHELFERLEGGEGEGEDEAGGGAAAPGAGARKAASFGGTLAQILLLDIVFSLDSVITAVGMAPHIIIMITAMVLAVGVMLVFADAVSDFINRHPSMKVLALSFLLLIGVLLVADAFGKHVNKGYVYFAMGFSFAVELVNMRVRRRRTKRATTKNV